MFTDASPALLTRMSTLPNAVSVASTSPRAASGSIRSAVYERAAMPSLCSSSARLFAAERRSLDTPVRFTAFPASQLNAYIKRNAPL